jgi:hypothetical protein
MCFASCICRSGDRNGKISHRLHHHLNIRSENFSQYLFWKTYWIFLVLGKIISTNTPEPLINGV